MEALELLNTRVDELLARMNLLLMENARLQTELSDAMREKTVLAEENHNLHVSLENLDGLRAEALRRIESLLIKIRDHESVG